MRNDRHGDGAQLSRASPAPVSAAFFGLGLAGGARRADRLALAFDTIRQSSATYDEVAYLRVAARWWRTGDQAEITRMGSPLTFWKLQQAPDALAARLSGPAPVDR